MNVLYVLIGLVLGVVLWVIGSYNKLVTLKTRVRESLADIDVQLKRRYDLIPNLINTVKGAANFEQSTLEKVIQARNSAMNTSSSNLKEKAENENQLTGALKSVFALSESYPDLKASANFLELQRELSDTEDKIQAARRFYNNTVKDLNTTILSFPGNLIAEKFAYTEEAFFELAEEEKAVATKAPEVSF